MKTRKMRLVSALLALAMLFVMMPVGAFATNDSKTSGSCGAEGSNITWKVEKNSDKANDGTQGWTLTLEGSGEMADYEQAYGTPNGPVPWESVRNQITQVSIPQGVTRIGNSALWGMVSLTNVTIPDGVKTIGDRAFEGCGVTKIDLPDSVTRIGKEAFENCENLEEVKLSKSLTDIVDNAFSNCSALKQMDIPEGVTTIGTQAFSGCALLSSINIPNSVTNIGAVAFFNCSKLTSIDIPNGVTSIEMGTFYGCSALKSIDIPSSVTTIGDVAFAMCTALKKITIPQQVETIGERAFATCAQLEKIDIASDSSLTTVGDHAFDTTNFYDMSGELVGNLSNTQNEDIQYIRNELGITELAQTKLSCDAELKELVSGKGVLAENIMASATVTFVDGEQTESKTVACGGTVEMPKPTKEGYTFIGWVDANGNAFDFTKPVTANTTLYAKWEAIPGQLTVTGGTFTVKDKNVETKTEGDTLMADIPEGAEVTVTFHKDAYADSNLTFDGWKIEGLVDAENYTNKEEFTFTMPKNGVTIAAQTKAAAPAEDDSLDAATVVTGVVLGTGTAILAYHIGTEVYAEQVLGKGVAIPRTREEVALKAWELAGKPAVELNGEPLSEAAQAEKWAVESGLMQNVDGSFNGSKKMSKLKALRTLDAAKKLG